MYRSLMTCLFASHSIEAGALRSTEASVEADGGVAVPGGEATTAGVTLGCAAAHCG